MIRCIHTLLLCVCTCTLIWVTCVLPPNPAEDPKNAAVSLFLPDGDNTVQQGNHKQFGMWVMYPQHIDFYRVTSTCSNLDTTIKPSLLNVEDTIFFNPQFQNEGSCIIQVTAEYLDSHYKGITDSLILVVLPGEPVLEFSVKPTAFTTHSGTTDTLRFVINASQVNDISYTVTCDPEVDSAHAHRITPVAGYTVLIHFDPDSAGTYIVMLSATAGELSASASVTVTVLESIAPTFAENPQTLITGTPDTLIFTLTPEQVVRGVTMELLDVENLPADIATVIPSGADSLIIAVNSAEEGSLSFSIVTTSGVLTDTATCTFTIVDQNNAVWTTASAAIDAVEGQQCSVDLTPYLFEGVFIKAIAPTATIGSFNDSGAWYYTPPWGSEARVSVTITGKRGETSQDLSLTLNVAPGDEAAPGITLLSPAIESKTVSSSQATVSVIVKDAGAGVDKVTFATASETFAGTPDNDSTYTAVITGLAQGTATEVTITATDKSMKKNSSSKTITLTYDSTMEDGDAPVFTQVGGPQSGDRVTTATGTITYAVNDDSGVDSVWWTLNDAFAAAVAASEDNQYTITYTLSEYGENAITLYAKDGSSGGNEGSRTITLNYNTDIAPVTPSGPQDGATDVSLTPSFTWTGGTDADGDSVFYRVLYGTSATALSQMTAILTSNTVTLGSASKLTPTTLYYWQVIAWSKAFPDTARSDVISFTTLDPTAEDTTGPQISQTAGPEDGDRVTVATGTITVSVSDPNGVASVTAKLNSGTALALTAGTNNTYAYNYTLSTYGENTITFTAVDGSANSNSSELPITLVYNTEPTGITLTTPAADASDVSVSPTFKWSGGDDEDGDGVTYTVHYGTSQTNLTGTTTVTGETATPGSPLAYAETYYWQVTATSASTDYPDEVQSSVETFTTEGSLPTISVHPQSQPKEEGQSVTFSVTATGFGTLSYQWRENGQEIEGEDYDSYTISSVTTSMDGNTYDCVVKNEVGEVTSNAATLTVTEIPSFTVSFNMHGGDPIESQTVVRDGYAEEPPTPQRDGFAFKGWFTSSTDTTEFDFNTPITTNKTIHARWAEVYTVTYHSNTADSGSVPTDTRKYESGELVTVAGNSGNLYKNGYSFSGWTTSENGTGTVYNNPNTIPVGSAAIHLYAKWELITYSITCHNNDGTGTNPTSYTITSSTITLSEPTKLAYVFGSWYANSGFSGSAVTSIPAGSTGNKEFWAKWVIRDIDGNEYTEIAFGSQVWMVENLKVTHYNDGSAIPNVTDNSEWYALSTVAYCWHSNNQSNKEPFGALYNWYAASDSRLAPEGWHVANESEWDSFLTYLVANGYNYDESTGEQKVAKSLATNSGWSEDNGYVGSVGANQETNNSTGFSGYPAAGRGYNGLFSDIGFETYWWTKTQGTNSSYGVQYGFYSIQSSVQKSTLSSKYCGYSIRCIRNY